MERQMENKQWNIYILTFCRENESFTSARFNIFKLRNVNLRGKSSKPNITLSYAVYLEINSKNGKFNIPRKGYWRSRNTLEQSAYL